MSQKNIFQEALDLVKNKILNEKGSLSICFKFNGEEITTIIAPTEDLVFSELTQLSHEQNISDSTRESKFLLYFRWLIK